MQRVGLDSIVSQDPLTYQSVFSIPKAHFENPTSSIIQSDLSGLGWRFCLQTSPSSALDKDPHTHKAIVIFELDPWLIALLAASFSFVQPSCSFRIGEIWQTPLPSFDPVSSSQGSFYGSLHYQSTALWRNRTEKDGTILFITHVVLLRRTSLVLPTTKPHSRTSQVIADSISTGTFINTKVYLYSARAADGTVKKPKSFFASSAILARAKSEALDLHFSSHGFKDSGAIAIDIHRLPSSDLVASDYDYDSDSDLEDEDELESYIAPTLRQPTSNAIADDLDAQMSDGTPGYPRINSQYSRLGRVVFLRGTAARTWEAFQHYLYFDEITFAKLKSTYKNRKAARARFTERSCSPKSMYRFADQFGLDELKILAFNNLETQLSNANLATEAFSSFSSRYPEILDLEVARLTKNYNDDQIKTEVVSAVGRLAKGEDQLQTVLEKILKSMGGVSTPTTSSSSQPTRSKRIAKLEKRRTQAFEIEAVHRGVYCRVPDNFSDPVNPRRGLSARRSRRVQ
ncbi:hypothetical protein CYLTODRAFT_423871 [Cylindrobasidium torrendii FP15055 ss-10]|uniref:Uncharacterized protein n=1 Tax=Cylindrobasidium torrendii FP15055 ss-10 TaxID=1314674 RepID=A0A0D7B8Z3_9AGAR|nr:hypothetical protein CYLTODRAFT_423871 [Cylindrobasidium torrendii FP15055 ss-10]